MCIAEINVSTLPCRHRWYRLARSCCDGTNLSNCPNRLGLEGWEIKCEFCPYCAGWSDAASYRLVSQDRRQSVSSMSRSPSLSASRRESRSYSLSRSEARPIPIMSAQIASSANVAAASEKNRALNARLDAYLGSSPSEKLQHVDSMSSRMGLSEDGELSSSPSSSRASTHESVPDSTGESSFGPGNPNPADRYGVLGKSWKRTKRFSRTLFK